MFTQLYQVHITTLVINSLGCRHTYTHIDYPHRINFKKPGMLQPAWFTVTYFLIVDKNNLYMFVTLKCFLVPITTPLSTWIYYSLHNSICIVIVTNNKNYLIFQFVILDFSCHTKLSLYIISTFHKCLSQSTNASRQQMLDSTLKQSAWNAYKHKCVSSAPCLAQTHVHTNLFK